ncbi:MAG: ComEC/Rec2 family competence protein [Blastocatellales bacterium]
MTRRISFTGLGPVSQPLLYVCAFFMLGLIVASRIGGPGCAWFAPAILSWGMGLGLLCRGEIRPVAFGLALLWIGGFACGGWLQIRHQGRDEGAALRALAADESRDWEAPIGIIGVLDAEPEPAPARIYLSLSIESLSSFRITRRIDGRIRMTVPLPDGQAVSEFSALDLRYGTRLRLTGHLKNRRVYRNPGSVDLEALLARQGYDAGGVVKSPLLIEPLSDGNGNRILAMLYRIRGRALNALIERVSQPACGILAAGLLGNRYYLTRRAGEMFREGGTYHLLVISGLHIGVLAGLIWWLAGVVAPGVKTRFALTTGTVWGYAIMVGAQPAVTRAAIMLTIVLGGRLIFRDGGGANSVAASAIVLLVRNPSDLYNPAFQLSLLTVFVIVAVTVPLYVRLRTIGRWKPSPATPYPPSVHPALRLICETLFWDEMSFRREMRQSPIRYRLEKARAATILSWLRIQRAIAAVVGSMLAAGIIQLAMLPLMIGYFHRVSFIAPLANVVEGLFMLALLAGGACFLIAHSVFEPAGRYLAKPVELMGDAVIGVGGSALDWRWASVRPPDFGEEAAALYAAWFICLLILIVALSRWNPMLPPRKSYRMWKPAVRAAIAGAAALAFILIVHPVSHRFSQGRLTVTFLDVGQGDSILVAFPRGKLMLLDSGGRVEYRSPDGPNSLGSDDFEEDRMGVAEAALLPHLWFRGISRLDQIVASHGDADHIEAFDELIDAMRVDSAAEAARNDTSISNSFREAVKGAGIPLRGIGSGDSFELDGVTVDVLWPDRETGPMSENNGSAVLRLRYGRRTILLTGDIESEPESRLTGSYSTELRADVLKVPHHGSKTSSMQKFLEAVRPGHAVISAALPSPFGHPHPDVVGRLRQIGARIWETGRCGAVTASTDGNDLIVESHVRCGSDARSADIAPRSSRGR